MNFSSLNVVLWIVLVVSDKLNSTMLSQTGNGLPFSSDTVTNTSKQSSAAISSPTISTSQLVCPACPRTPLTVVVPQSRPLALTSITWSPTVADVCKLTSAIPNCVFSLSNWSPSPVNGGLVLSS